MGNTNYFVLALGVVAILVLVLGERMLPGRPVALSVVALLTAAASMLGFPRVATTGEFPAGLPALGLMYRDNLDHNGAERRYCEPLPGIKAAAIDVFGPIPREANNAAMDRAWAFSTVLDRRGSARERRQK